MTSSRILPACKFARFVWKTFTGFYDEKKEVNCAYSILDAQSDILPIQKNISQAIMKTNILFQHEFARTYSPAKVKLRELSFDNDDKN